MQIQESGAGVVWGLNLALRNRRNKIFKIAGLKEIDFPSLRITKEDLEGIRIICQNSLFVDFEIDGVIYDSEDFGNLSVKKKMMFRFSLNDCLNDDERPIFFGFKDNKGEE